MTENEMIVSAKNKDTQELRDKILACLYGGALGDALGYIIEFDSWDRIKKIYGKDGIQELEKTGQKAIFSYLDWLQTQGYSSKSFWDEKSILKQRPEMNKRRAPGNTCLSALASGEMGTIEQPLNNSKGCGGVMRTAPCGFIRTRESGTPDSGRYARGHSRPLPVW